MNELIVKDNALINASYNLEITEQRLILLAILHARETGKGITADSKLEIHAEEYMKHFHVEKHAAYEALKNAVNTLFNRQFSYSIEYKNTGKIGIVKSRWVSRIFYVDSLAILEITFAPDVVPLITRLEEQFTSYQLKQVSRLTSKYSIRLYELLMSWKETGKTPVFEINDFRYKLGLDPQEYTAMHNFKTRVLESAIKQINEYTDILVSYDQYKQGRTITGFQFKFIHKGKSITSFTSIEEKTEKIIKLTEKQILFFANKLAYDDAFSSKFAAVGEEYVDVEQRLMHKLGDPKFVKKHLNTLKRIGFNIK